MGDLIFMFSESLCNDIELTLSQGISHCARGMRAICICIYIYDYMFES